MNFNTLEKEIFSVLCQVGRQVMAEYLQKWDQIIMARRETAEYRCVDTRSTSIKTIMGEVAYERYYYKKHEGGYTFLLDEAMGLGNGYGLFSENLAEQILIECAEKSYQKAAETISSITGQKISRMGAWNIVQGYGQMVQKQEERLEELDGEGVAGQMGNVPSPALFAEFDDVWLNMQRETRRRTGIPVEKGRKRTGMKPMHIGTAYTGWVQLDDGRYATVNKFAYAMFSDSADFITKFEVLLRQRFDMDGVEQMVINGDGEAWIKTIAENNDAVLQLDPFHKGQAIMRAVKDKDRRKELNKAIAEKDVDGAIDRVCGMIATSSSDMPTLKKLEDLATYLVNNRDFLLPWQERGIRMPEPPAGVVYRNMGTQEHSNCDLLTQRMKHRKGSWSTGGANNMARVLCLRNTIGLDAMLGALPEPTGAAWLPTEPLSAAKTPQYDGKGYDASWLYAGMPFEETFRTLGREAIRGMLRPRPLVELKYT